MLKGRNKMHLNHSAIMAMIQAWIDRDTSLQVKVTSIDYKPGDDYFEVTVEGDTFTQAQSEVRFAV